MVEHVVDAHDEKVRRSPFDQRRDVEREARVSVGVMAGRLAVHPDVGHLEDGFELHVHAARAPGIRHIEPPAIPAEPAEVARYGERVVKRRVPGMGKVHLSPGRIVVGGLFRAHELGFDRGAGRGLTLEAPAVIEW